MKLGVGGMMMFSSSYVITVNIHIKLLLDIY